MVKVTDKQPSLDLLLVPGPVAGNLPCYFHILWCKSIVVYKIIMGNSWTRFTVVRWGPVTSDLPTLATAGLFCVRPGWYNSNVLWDSEYKQKSPACARINVRAMPMRAYQLVHLFVLTMPADRVSVGVGNRYEESIIGERYVWGSRPLRHW